MSELTVRDYENHVTELASCVIDELRYRVKAGESGESLREWLIEHIHETCDSSAWVIYTAKAQFIVCHRGTEAYTDQFGEEGLTKDGDINWPAIAYMALEQDVIEELDRQDIDVNDPENSDAFEDIRLEREAREAVQDLERERCVELLTACGIQCRDDETVETLREAVRVNIVDGTIALTDI